VPYLFIIHHRLCQNVGLSVLPSIGETEKRGEWWMTVMLFLVKDSLVKKRKCEMVCCDATPSYIAAKDCCTASAYIHAVAVKHHSSVQNLLFGLSGGILCEQSP
jgi:hypothetical protein